MLAFIEKLTLRPDDVTSDDIALLRTSGLSDAAIDDAVHVCAACSMIDRLADALDFAIPSSKAVEQSAGRLLKRGYA